MTTNSKYKITTQTIKFGDPLKFKADIHLMDKEVDEPGFDRTTALTITDNKEKEIKLQVDWCNYSTTERDFTFLIIPETGNLFFATRFSWGVLDLNALKVIRQESCEEFWSFERHADTIVVITELEALALNLTGQTIDKVPIDPPFDSKDFLDRIEFASPVHGRQILRLN